MHTRPTLRPMSATLRVLAALLGYPDAPMRALLPEMGPLLHRERALSPARLAELDTLIGALRDADPLEAESGYVELFDRGRRTALHLFEHVHGDARERGPAMVDLGRTYEAAGLVLVDGELPDYLPVVLEFVSTQPPREGRAFLGEMAHIFNGIHGALLQRDRGYAGAFAALLELAGEKVQPVAPPAEEPLDDSWAEPPVFDGCSSRGQAHPGQAQPVHIVRNRPTTPGATT
jgi:nitrate reductase molybdenum cofactor assembly chaperone NarJ/NarW